jgi:hypothetical protein
VELIGLDGTLYDQVLDTIFYLGLAPPRFQVPPPPSRTGNKHNCYKGDLKEKQRHELV